MEGDEKCHDLKLQCFLYIMRETISNIADIPKDDKDSFLWKECVGKILLIDDNKFDVINYKSSNRKFTLVYEGVHFNMTYVEFKNTLLNQKVNRIPFTHPTLIKYFIGGINEAIKYSHGCTKNINMRCPYCNEKKIYKPSYIARRNFMPCECNTKSMSYPEMVMFNLLKYLHEEFYREKRFPWCNFDIKGENTYGVFDFVLKVRKIIIEMDGGFHDKNETFFGKYRDVQYRDKQKDYLALKNGYKIIRIDSTVSDITFLKENIKKSELSKYLNLSSVDWNEIEEKSRDNIHKEICEYKKAHPECFVSDIATHFNLKNDFVRESLKSGDKIGWCVYNPKEEVKRRNKIYNMGFKKGVCHDFTKRYIEVCKYDLDGNYLETYKSKKEAAEIYGSGVYGCTIETNKKNHHKTAGGYQWRTKTDNYMDNIGCV